MFALRKEGGAMDLEIGLVDGGGLRLIPLRENYPIILVGTFISLGLRKVL